MKYDIYFLFSSGNQNRIPAQCNSVFDHSVSIANSNSVGVHRKCSMERFVTCEPIVFPQRFEFNGNNTQHSQISVIIEREVRRGEREREEDTRFEKGGSCGIQQFTENHLIHFQHNIRRYSE